MAHPNEEPLRERYDAFTNGDLAPMKSKLADGLTLHVPGGGPMRGDKGVGEVMSWVEKSVELSSGTLRVQVHDILANDKHGVVLARTTAERLGKRLADEEVVVFHIRDGKVVEISEYPGDLHAAEEFWSSGVARSPSRSAWTSRRRTTQPGAQMATCPRGEPNERGDVSCVCPGRGDLLACDLLRVAEPAASFRPGSRGYEDPPAEARSRRG